MCFSSNVLSDVGNSWGLLGTSQVQSPTASTHPYTHLHTSFYGHTIANASLLSIYKSIILLRTARALCPTAYVSQPFVLVTQSPRQASVKEAALFWTMVWMVHSTSSGMPFHLAEPAEATGWQWQNLCRVTTAQIQGAEKSGTQLTLL